MAKSQVNILHHPALIDIPDEEWPDYFAKSGTDWTQEDIDYLCEWYGKDDIVSLAYALERPPWALYREIRKLRPERGLPYLRKRANKGKLKLPEHPSKEVKVHGTIYLQLYLFDMDEYTVAQ